MRANKDFKNLLLRNRLPVCIIFVILFMITKNNKNLAETKSRGTDAYIPAVSPFHAPDVGDIDLSAPIDARANEIVNAYMDTVQNKVGRLRGKKGRSRYMAALKGEFGSPAPVCNGKHAHCVWGQRLSWAAAIGGAGLDIDVMPHTDACETLIKTMRDQEPEKTFYGAIYQSRDGFDLACEKFVSAKISRWRASLKYAPSEEELSQKYEIFAKEFIARNIAADDIPRGSIYSTYSHTQIFLGRGFIENRKFVADDNSDAFYTIGFNGEILQQISFRGGKTGNLFIAKTVDILIRKLYESAEQIKSMSRESLISSIIQKGILTDGEYIKTLPDNELKVILLENLLNASLQDKTISFCPAMFPQQNVRKG